MQVVFWGTRGSLPRPLSPSHVRSKVARAVRLAVEAGLDGEDDVEEFVDRLPFDVSGTFGGNTSCVEVRGGDAVLVLDAGTGLRDLGFHLASTGNASPLTVHLLLSHLHWDHIQGFPFFSPAFIPGTEIHVHGVHDGIGEAFAAQQQPPFFPVPLDTMPATVEFHRIEPDRWVEIAGFRIRPFLQHHPGDSYGYVVEREGRTVVYSTDSEHYDDAYDEGYPFVDVIRGADLLIFDAAYSLADELVSKRDWGHSNNLIGVELAARAGVGHLCLVHHDHSVGDEQMMEVLDKTRRYAALHESSRPMKVDVAHDGLVLEV